MKPVLMINDHEELVNIHKTLKESSIFLEKKYKALQKEEDACRDEFWKSVYQFLKKENLYKDPKNLKFTFRDGVLYEMSEEDSQANKFSQFMKNLLQ